MKRKNEDRLEPIERARSGMKKIIFIQLGSGQFAMIRQLRKYNHYHLSGQQQRKLEKAIVDEKLDVNRLMLKSTCTDTDDKIAHVINKNCPKFEGNFGDFNFDIQGVYDCLMKHKKKEWDKSRKTIVLDIGFVNSNFTGKGKNGLLPKPG